ncbi:MAG: hypothetical protein WDA59_05720 [Methanofastidiosum sp.]|jgi:hypothetical protein|nr:hypothetical protein [Tenuifilaceae bacterium]
MAKTRYYTPNDRVDNLLSSMKIRDLKQAAIARGLNFRRVTEASVLELQSWLMLHWDGRTDRTLLNDYDVWLEQELREEGLEELIHPLLRLGYLGEDEDGNLVRKQLKNISISNVKSKKELSQYLPRRGSRKELVFEIIRNDPLTPTEDLIEEVLDQFPDVSIGSIKSWASKARKTVRYGEEIKNEKPA